MLRPDDEWIWDSWIADEGESYHLFFLTAPRAPGDPGRRHHVEITDPIPVELCDGALRGAA